MSYQQPSTIITRKARVWPDIPEDTVTLPQPPLLPGPPQAIMLSTIFFSLAGMAVYGFVFTHLSTGESSVLIIPFIAISGFVAIGSLITFTSQTIIVRQRIKSRVRTYQQQLQEAEKQLGLLSWKERQAYMELNPPLGQYDFKSIFYEKLDVKPLLQNSFDEHNMNLWTRHPDDPDFLEIRIGIGKRPATYHIHERYNEESITAHSILEASTEHAKKLRETYSSVYVPLLVKLTTQNPLAIVGPGNKLGVARELLHAMVSHIAYHHSPEDVRIIILAPRSQEAAWQWTSIIPHTVRYDPRQSSEHSEEVQRVHACAIGTGAVMEYLPIISQELGRRELLNRDSGPSQKTPLLPHLVIIVDEFDAPEDLDHPTQALAAMPIPSSNPIVYRRARLSVSPLKRPEMALALSCGQQLGVSVLCTTTNQARIPASSQVLIDLTETHPPQTLHSEMAPLSAKAERQVKKKQAAAELSSPTNILPQGTLRFLNNKPGPTLSCLQLDSTSLEDLRSLSLRLQSLRAMTSKRLEMRTQVDLRTLFEPSIDLNNYDPFVLWNDPLFRTPKPSLRIPIGLKIGDEVQYLDLLKDGPHGILIGQTGSGKSELLQTIILSLAFIYKPTEVNFLLLDYHTGRALEPFCQLPHTIGFLPHVASATTIQRFITLLRAEATKREETLKAGKSLPQLIIIIEGFAEMAQHTEANLDELFAITRMERELGMHLLLAARRPEGILDRNARDHIQYRLCLRCASPEDSREVLRRTDAASLPASIPGRGYLLHGDNQLDLFQAARVTISAAQEANANAQAQLNSLLSLPFKGK